jgi:competence protein ComEA
MSPENSKTRTRALHHRIAATLLAVVLLLAGATAAAKPSTEMPKKAPAAAAPAEGVVNLNTATEDQLRLLPRIGATKAAAILKHRTKQKFKATHELTRIKGIGRKTFLKLRPFLAVDGPTTLTAKVKLSSR